MEFKISHANSILHINVGCSVVIMGSILRDVFYGHLICINDVLPKEKLIMQTNAGVKLGTMMGVFVPCLQNILGIIYYIRFSW